MTVDKARNGLASTRRGLRYAIGRGRDALAASRRSADTPGSTGWLIHQEGNFGGKVSGVARRTISPNDSRPTADINRGGMQGGDRMSYAEHGYAPVYAEALNEFIEIQGPVVLVEIGILTGTGLAIWCNLFPKGDILGLDIDTTHFAENRSALEARGAFKECQPSVYEYDQLGTFPELLEKHLAGREIDIVIDDGLHSGAAILGSLRHFLGRMSAGSLYVIEDNPRCLPAVRSGAPSWRWKRHGGLILGRPASHKGSAPRNLKRSQQP